MKCAKCEVKEIIPSVYKNGELFLTINTTQKYDSGGMFRNASTTYKHSGLIITWFVCDKCQRKTRIKNSLSYICLNLILISISIFFYFFAPGLLLISGIFYIVCSYQMLEYFFYNDKIKSNISRDTVLNENLTKLIDRDDFISRYGKIILKNDTQAFTRLQRRIK